MGGVGASKTNSNITDDFFLDKKFQHNIHLFKK